MLNFLNGWIEGCLTFGSTFHLYILKKISFSEHSFHQNVHLCIYAKKWIENVAPCRNCQTLFKSHAPIFKGILPGDRDRRKVVMSLCIILCNKCPAICFNSLALQKIYLFFKLIIDATMLKICKWKTCCDNKRSVNKLQHNFDLIIL